MEGEGQKSKEMGAGGDKPHKNGPCNGNTGEEKYNVQNGSQVGRGSRERSTQQKKRTRHDVKKGEG